MKSLIIYSSRHHGNTRKLVEAIAQQFPVDLQDADVCGEIEMEEYALIGFASGIDFGKFYPTVTEAARRLPKGKRVYALFTCARDNGKYGNEIRDLALEQGCIYLGKYGCRGYNTYGPWKLIGGMNKDHPDSGELSEAVTFYKALKSHH